jgi:hypothetical protein
MSSDDFQDRETILKRRAIFVASALSQVLAASALTGCPQDLEPRIGGSAMPVASIPHADGGQLPASSSSATVTPEPRTTKIPPLVVPDDVNETAKRHFEHLKQEVPKIHAELDGADQLTRGMCSIEDGSCDGTWAQLARHLSKARDMGYDLGARCGGQSDDAKRFEKSLSAHRKAIQGRVDAIQGRIDQLLDSDAKKSKWEGHRAKAAIPRPCLKYACDDW